MGSHTSKQTTADNTKTLTMSAVPQQTSLWIVIPTMLIMIIIGVLVVMYGRPAYRPFLQPKFIHHISAPLIRHTSAPLIRHFNKRH